MTKMLQLFMVFVLFACSNVASYASVIGDLNTKEQVKRFVIARLSADNVFSVTQFASLIAYTSESSHYYPAYTDTMEVFDPIADSFVLVTTVYGAGTYHHHPDTIDLSLGMQQRYDLSYWISEYKWNYYKADIDANGYTDLVIDVDTKGVVVVMDFASGVEGHILSDSPDFSLYRFKDFLSLPDGTTALLLKRYPCIYAYNTLKDTQVINRNVLTDTVVYRFRGFAKYSKAHGDIDIAKLRYQYRKSTGFGNDGFNCIEINRNGSCFMNNTIYPDLMSASVDSVNLAGLWNYIEYIDIKSQTGYWASIDHSWGSSFVVSFTDGTEFTLAFWGYKPPMELAYLSKGICDISKSLKWHSDQTDYDFDCIFPSYRNGSEDVGDCDWLY